MRRRQTATTLLVLLNGQRVGSIERERSAAISFRYSDEWLSSPSAVPISLSLPLDERLYRGDAVLNVLDNLLPDEPAVRRSVAERFGASGTDPYSLLARIGRDCVGALQFMPIGQESAPSDKLTGEPLDDDDIASLLAGLERAPLGVSDDIDFRISLAGAQEKTVFIMMVSGSDPPEPRLPRIF